MLARAVFEELKIALLSKQFKNSLLINTELLYNLQSINHSHILIYLLSPILINLLAKLSFLGRNYKQSTQQAFLNCILHNYFQLHCCKYRKNVYITITFTLIIHSVLVTILICKYQFDDNNQILSSLKRLKLNQQLKFLGSQPQG
ncbi:transmembrane protein, putative (macronuclear) [Tetrahymena thermophila SB210]|uniref:Transmembrane protein, putative n=1 Tax=Tetrahymena thermophila (strain SB210) TaxID=312017 RepID=W7XJH8_TETTS|nr:transmembrane protein, putative [Tetrahymena thermophila SB210]EWS75536.1 transmembrane protein, putative [Tetrahymena thermophila SB210]|eukprot:XP_012651932.1 transmembrane protein, putative [Tetrahymena thermophila SB210]